jgi:hypothetical protein
MGSPINVRLAKQELHYTIINIISERAKTNEEYDELLNYVKKLAENELNRG